MASGSYMIGNEYELFPEYASYLTHDTEDEESFCEEDYLMTPSKNIYIYKDMIEINQRPLELKELKIKEEKQETEAASEIIGNTVIKTEIEDITEQEIKDEVFKPPTSNTLPVLSYIKNKNKADIKTKNQNVREKKKIKEDTIVTQNTIIKKIKVEEQEDCVDVETIPRDEIPILEAHDAKSLLEKFEACENPNPCDKLIVKKDLTYDTRPNKTCQVTQECRVDISEKSVSQVSNQQTSILSKKIINKTKLSERKKSSPLNIRGSKRKSTRMQDEAFCNKTLKIDSTVPNDAKSPIFKRSLVQLDHDYCNNDNFHTTNYNSNKTTKSTSVLRLNQFKHWDQLTRCHNNGSSNKQCHLESTNICDTNEKPTVLQNKIKDDWLENYHKDYQKETLVKHSHDLNNSPTVKNINISNASSTVEPFLLSIRSPLARKIILQSQKHVSPKTNIVKTNSKIQYISVLKNPPNPSQSQFAINNPNKNRVTTINSSDNEVQNIIVQNTQDTLPHHEEDKTSRVKISVLEYRKRISNDKTRNDKPMIMKESSRTVLVDIYHASTMKPLLKPDQEIKDTFWCEREIMPCWKKVSDIQEEKNKPKLSTRHIQTQTDETIFEYLKSVDVEEEDEKIMEGNQERERSTKNERQKSCEEVSRSLSRSRSKSSSRYTASSSRYTTSSSSSSRSSSRSRSRSNIKRSRDRRRNRSKSKNRSGKRSRSKSRTRNRNRSRSISIHRRSTSRSNNRSSSRSRSRSRSRVNQRSSRRTISHRTRRSSVTSTSSWTSSLSISLRSKHSYTHSRSRSHIRSRSRSRSRSSERFYSKRSRSPSASNLRRNKWSNQRRTDSRDRERNYDKYERRERSYGKYDRRERSYDKYERSSFANRHDNRSYRSPLNSYSETCDNWHNRKKQREIEERRVVYVGRIDEGITKSDLRKRFEVFGPVEDISVHFREHGENYGFITFLYNNDAYEAVEHGNDNPSLPEYTLSFGGRRAFCKSKYADLDNVEDDDPIRRPHNEEMSYDYLLKSTAYMLKKKV
ncbi:Peroxisome proliferator-activated receptor gamma coactivator-related protein 1 [Cyphomyrmex costatus]|uniref:Peroxisome proliferator-activated receptor gamma coactivator-related protein 1 n=1 Tax=Cyphomyrmex costatus TaxID=456900 RepID=A0A151IQB7_9HYME|nr:Peroxisome proliferator-activated receptor gamma coactivator-related protein 1 [Cyphomyrmex costatus]